MKRFFLVFAFFISNFIFSQEIISKSIKSNSDDIISDIVVNSSMVEEFPLHPNCSEFGSNKDKNNCMNRMIAQHVQANLNIKNINCPENENESNLVQPCNEQLQPGRKRINVSFIIGTSGNIEDVKVVSSYPVIANEVKKVIESLPKMKPGTQSGQPVRVRYALPVIYTIN